MGTSRGAVSLWCRLCDPLGYQDTAMPLRIRVMYLLAAGAATLLMVAHSHANNARSALVTQTAAPEARAR